MNNKGAGKAKYILLIPIFVIILLLILDTFISYLENKRFKKDTEAVITEVMNKEDITIDDYEEEIKRAYERKNYDTSMLLVNASNYDVYVENEHYYFGLFTSLKTYNYITEDVKILGMNFKKIKSIKKINNEYGEINILGVKFRVKKGSKSFVKVTVRRNNNGELEFDYEK